MCSKEVFPFHPIYLKYPFFLPVPAPDGLHIIQVASFCLCFQQAKAKDLLCVISWTLGVALQITKGDARFLHSCHFHLFFFFPIIYSLHMCNSWQIFITFSFHWDKRLCLWREVASGGAHSWWKLQPKPPYSIMAKCTSHPMGKFHTSAASRCYPPPTTLRAPGMKTQVSWASSNTEWPAG